MYLSVVVPKTVQLFQSYFIIMLLFVLIYYGSLCWTCIVFILPLRAPFVLATIFFALTCIRGYLFVFSFFVSLYIILQILFWFNGVFSHCCFCLCLFSFTAFGSELYTAVAICIEALKDLLCRFCDIPLSIRVSFDIVVKAREPETV